MGICHRPLTGAARFPRVCGWEGVVFADRCDEQHRQYGGNDGDPQQWADGVVQQLIQEQPQGGADDGAGGVDGAVHPEDSTPKARVGAHHQQRIPWGAAHPLAQAVHPTADKHERPAAGKCDDEFAERGQPVPEPDQRALGAPIT